MRRFCILKPFCVNASYLAITIFVSHWCRHQFIKEENIWNQKMCILIKESSGRVMLSLIYGKEKYREKKNTVKIKVLVFLKQIYRYYLHVWFSNFWCIVNKNTSKVQKFYTQVERRERTWRSDTIYFLIWTSLMKINLKARLYETEYQDNETGS